MSGWRKIGARETYFPPFVNERFDGPPYWACTFTALLNGANVGYLGNREPSHAEVRKLALASGDADLDGGSKSSDMLTAMRVRYRKRMFLEALPPRRVHERLSSGWAMVAAVTYGALPKEFRRHSPNFKKGHRITLIGWNGRASWILDPMARAGTKYEGEPIPWSVFEPAWWSGEQLWFAEGMFRKPPQGEGPRQGTGWTMGDPGRLAAHRPTWREPSGDHAQGDPGRTKVGSLRRHRGGDPEERTLDGRVHPRIERRPQGHADSGPNAGRSSSSPSRARPLRPRNSRPLRRNRRRRLRSPRPKSSSADASSNTSGSRASSDRS